MRRMIIRSYSDLQSIKHFISNASYTKTREETKTWRPGNVGFNIADKERNS